MSRYINFLRSDAEVNCRLFVRLMAKELFNALVTCTTRTDAEQRAAYNEGYSTTPIPSFHAEHSGLAFDICQDADTYDEQWNDAAFWEAAGRIGKAMGFTWGGDWTSFVDKPHFQWDNHGEFTGEDIRAKRYPPSMPLFTGTVPPPVKPDNVKELKKGSKGADVITLQTRLNALGYPCGKVDGDYGPKTEAAVKAFQKAEKKTDDGVVGQQTKAALENAKPTGLLLELKPSDIKRIEYVHGTEPVEKIAVAHKRIGCDIITNANFFGMASGIQTGYLADEGKVLSDWLLSKWGFEFPDKTKAAFSHWDSRKSNEFLGGYPCLIRDGKIAIDATEAGFSAASTDPKYRRGRMAIGIKADGTFVIRGVSDIDDNRLTVPELAECMLAVGCVNAINLDGGGSASWITPKSSYISSRAVDGFLAVWLA